MSPKSQPPLRSTGLHCRLQHPGHLRTTSASDLVSKRLWHKRVCTDDAMWPWQPRRTSLEFSLSIFWGGAWTGPPAFYYGCLLSPPPLVHLVSDTLPAPEAILLKKRTRLCPVTALTLCGLKATIALGARQARPPAGQQPGPRALLPGKTTLPGRAATSGACRLRNIPAGDLMFVEALTKRLLC